MYSEYPGCQTFFRGEELGQSTMKMLWYPGYTQKQLWQKLCDKKVYSRTAEKILIAHFLSKKSWLLIDISTPNYHPTLLKNMFFQARDSCYHTLFGCNSNIFWDGTKLDPNLDLVFLIRLFLWEKHEVVCRTASCAVLHKIHDIELVLSTSFE